MADKQNEEHPDQETVQETALRAPQTDVAAPICSRKSRIIKAADYGLKTGNCLTGGHSSGGVAITPLRKGEFISGVEVTCLCGEKIIIHFDLENSGKSA